MADQFHVVLATDWDARIPGYRKRKVFPRTRAGCSTCKSKKVKCDEKRPVCARCVRNGRHCHYNEGDSAQSNQLIAKSKVGIGIPTGGSSPYSFTLNMPSPFPLLNAKNGTCMLELMQYCESRWGDILHVEFTDVFKYMFQSSTLVRNVVLGITACHLRHLAGHNLRHQIAEHFYESLAVQDALGDAGRSSPDDCWVNISTEALGWLALQSGLRPLLKSGGHRLQGSMELLGPIFLGVNESRHVAMSQGLRGVPETWINFFDLGTAAVSPSTCSPGQSSDDSRAVVSNLPLSEVLGAPMMLVAFLRQVEPLPTNSFHHFAFLAKAHPHFRELLYQQDEKATWLYGYWCGLMCRFKGLWWSRDRSRRDYEAVRQWFQELDPAARPGLEGELWKNMIYELEIAPNW
ncbi:unnamed protein product [Clonostachys rosea]|uniref:Zn(2)-C6 fungal-type domain-containing protein n=1 Tax=Bionectria ochroleuca TaxID=29856 RepID=A0ABY6UJ98_BIOOC|nr:unnamed protein product [Clonostachys rosea]